MLKYVILTSLKLAFIASLLFFLVLLPLYDITAAILCGVVAFPVTIFWCLILSSPLIYLRRKFNIKEPLDLILFALTGLFFGGLTSTLTLSSHAELTSFDSLRTIAIFSGVGMVCAVIAWYDAHKKVLLVSVKKERKSEV